MEEDKIDDVEKISPTLNLNFISLLKIVFVFSVWPEIVENFLRGRNEEQLLRLFRTSRRGKHPQ
jgi:hypothetical protein